MLSRGFASCSSAFEELYKRSEVTRKDQDEKFQKKVELLAEKKQQISRINDEIAQITQKLKENLTVNDREFYQKVNLQEGARLTLIRGVLKDLQTTLAKDVRSLFKDYIIPEPTVKDDKLTLKVNEEQVNLSFVSRKEELKKAWAACGYNALLPEKPILLVCGQMFGSGKTTFGKQLFNFNNPSIKAIFEEKYSSSHILYQTLPVFINIPSFRPEFLKSIDDLVSCSIFVETLNQFFSIDTTTAIEFWKNNKLTTSACASLLLSMVHRPLFFHFDEVKNLSAMFPPIRIEGGAEIDVFHQFWGLVAEVQTRGCFVYACGRTPALNFFGTYCSAFGSVGQAVHIRLSLFKTNDIQDILWSSSSSNATSIGARLMISTEKEAHDTANWLYKMTTGVPHYVEHALMEMVAKTDSAKYFINWKKTPEELMLERLQLVQDLIPRFDLKDETRKNEIESLVRYAIDESELGGMVKINNHPVTDLVQYYGFYVETVENESKDFRIKIPRLWVYADIFQELSSNTLLKIALNLPTAWEDHVERVLLVRSANPTGKQTIRVKDKIPFLSETIVADEFYPELQIKRMENNAQQKNRGETFQNSVSISTSGCLLVRSSDKSSLPDLVTLLPISDKGRYFIGWQMKNYTKSTLGLPKVKTEIKKFTDILPAQGFKGGVFVILLNGLGTPVVEKNRGKVIRLDRSQRTCQGDEDNEEVLELDLPENVEVFIPTQKQLEEYFGVEPLKLLSQRGKQKKGRKNKKK